MFPDPYQIKAFGTTFPTIYILVALLDISYPGLYIQFWAPAPKTCSFTLSCLCQGHISLLEALFPHSVPEMSFASFMTRQSSSMSHCTLSKILHWHHLMSLQQHNLFPFSISYTRPSGPQGHLLFPRHLNIELNCNNTEYHYRRL